eukprot:7139765-Ditylum_brightwellii.AAC.1
MNASLKNYQNGEKHSKNEKNVEPNDARHREEKDRGAAAALQQQQTAHLSGDVEDLQNPKSRRSRQEKTFEEIDKVRKRRRD